MESSEVYMMRGRVLYVNGDTVYMGRGRWLLHSIDGGKNWFKRAILPVYSSRELFVYHRLGRRLFRIGFHHLLELGLNSSFVVAHRYIYRLGPEGNKLERITSLRGSRPLSICIGDGLVCYGEYRDNSERSPVHIWAARGDLRQWNSVWFFRNIRHVHGVFHDPYDNKIWVTTGDTDEECGIWVTDDRFKTLDKVVGGSQQVRAIQLLFTKRHVYFGSDTPLERNFIYRLDRETGKVEKLQEVESSVFWGCKVGNYLFFSTAVEPSKVNKCREACIWGSKDGETWKCLASFCKDIWPMKLFQYGQIFFPAGENNTDYLWFTPYATEKHMMVQKVNVKDLF